MECRRVYKDIYYANETDAPKCASHLKDTYIVCVRGNYSYRTTTRKYTHAKVIINYVTSPATLRECVSEFIRGDLAINKYFREREIIAVLFVYNGSIVFETTRGSRMVDIMASQLSKVSL